MVQWLELSPYDKKVWSLTPGLESYYTLIGSLQVLWLPPILSLLQYFGSNRHEYVSVWFVFVCLWTGKLSWEILRFPNDTDFSYFTVNKT